MWTAFKALAASIGLSPERVAQVERDGGVSLVQHPLNPELYIKVRPDPDWNQRLGEAWNGTLINSRTEQAGTIPVSNGLLAIAEADTVHNEAIARVVPGQYEVSFVVAHHGAEETYDYEEHISHAFAVLQNSEDVVSIEPLTNDYGIELGVDDAYGVAFAAAGVLKEIVGDHAGRWMLRMGDLMHPRSPDGNVVSNKSFRVESNDGPGAAIILHGGCGRGNYPLWRLADVNGNTVGVIADFFVDNRP